MNLIIYFSDEPQLADPFLQTGKADLIIVFISRLLSKERLDSPAKTLADTDFGLPSQSIDLGDTRARSYDGAL